MMRKKKFPLRKGGSAERGCLANWGKPRLDRPLSNGSAWSKISSKAWSGYLPDRWKVKPMVIPMG